MAYNFINCSCTAGITVQKVTHFKCTQGMRLGDVLSNVKNCTFSTFCLSILIGNENKWRNIEDTVIQVGDEIIERVDGYVYIGEKYFEEIIEPLK